jgi:hypothetical protein
MPTYTVHEPLPRKDEISADPERFVFVRDGFHFWAFLLTPLWMLWRRLWLVTVLYLIVAFALQTGLWALGLDPRMCAVVGLLLALLIGFEAGSLRRWTLTRRGWRNLGVVVGDDLEIAERHFFAAWLPAERQSPSSLPLLPPPEKMSMSRERARQTLKEARDIIGLFPEPGALR